MSNKPNEKFNLFKTMGAVLQKDKPPLEDIKKIPPFIFRKYISNHPTGVLVVQAFNIYDKVPIEHQFNYINRFFAYGKHKVKYIQYPKKMKDNDESLKILQQHYKISYVVAIEYYNTMGEKRVQEIINMYNTGIVH